jgi:hypothetical protein
MEHPLIHNIESLSLEELGSKISDLHRKLSIAHRMGNGHLCDQIRMALASYSSKHQEKMTALLKPVDTSSFNSKIDIS